MAYLAYWRNKKIPGDLFGDFFVLGKWELFKITLPYCNKEGIPIYCIYRALVQMRIGTLCSI
tara:strand:+ start:107 stop:292 length:186 start_codon:yes stop_codon:yes gene_type:complete